MTESGHRFEAPLSIIIPTLNEETALPLLLDDLKGQQDIDMEIVVADGGSKDGTVSTARARGVRVVSSGRGRAIQMNAGALALSGSYLLFLHADSRLSHPTQLADAVAFLDRAVSSLGHGRVAGHFALRFTRTEKKKNNLAFSFLEAKSRLNRPNTTNGDQGVLLPRVFFEAIGGFDESLPILEDQRLAEAIRRKGSWITLPGILETSARRFESEGFDRRYFLMAMMMGFYHTERWDFFHRARGVYRPQSETGCLDLSPFLHLTRDIVQSMSFRERSRFWLSMGQLVRRNLWQVFLFADVVVRGSAKSHRTPLLDFHDKVAKHAQSCGVWSRVWNPLADRLAAGLICGLFRLSGQKSEVRIQKSKET